MMIWRVSKGSPGIQTKFDSPSGDLLQESQWVSRLCPSSQVATTPAFFGHLITSNKIALLSNSFNLLPAWTITTTAVLPDAASTSKQEIFFLSALGSTNVSTDLASVFDRPSSCWKSLCQTARGRIVRNLGHPRPARKTKAGATPSSQVKC